MLTEISAQIDKYLIEQGGLAPEKVADKSIRMSDLDMDSLSMVEMIFEVEDKYGLHIEDVMRYRTMTLGEVIADIAETIENKPVKPGVPAEAAVPVKAAVPIDAAEPIEATVPEAAVSVEAAMPVKTGVPFKSVVPAQTVAIAQVAISE